jgi:hypothetical protein
MPDSPASKRSAEPAAVSDDGAAAATTDAAEEPEGPVTASAKEVFAAALEKKKAAGQSRSAHLDGHGGVGGATASHKATRTFRRKSG